MAELTRKSVLFLVEETTAGTAVAPSAGTEGVALQDGFSLTPEFEVLENAELSPSLGQKAPVLGIEQPSMTTDHYLRHSGTEGQEPNYKLLINSAMGDKNIAAAETTSAAGTDTTQIEVASATDLERGSAFLIKDSTNGFNIRAIESISGTTAQLSFDLGTAPANGTSLGQTVTYKPGTAAPTFSAWLYRGNGADVELVAGNRVETMDITIDAGEFINANYTTQGTEYSFNPIEITSSNNRLDFDDGGGEENATITTGIYKDPIELASAIQTAMDGLTADNITVTYEGTTGGSNLGKYTIASDGGTLSLLWNTGTNTANTIGGAIGFAVAADDTGATTYTSDNQITLTPSVTATFDSADPLVAKANELFIGIDDENTCIDASSVSVSINNNIQDVESICAVSGVDEKAQTAQTFSVDVTAKITKFEADFFNRFQNNTTVSFQYNFGNKSGGNWVAGQSGCIYSPTAKISSFELTDLDGIIVVSLSLVPFVNASNENEFFISFV